MNGSQALHASLVQTLQGAYPQLQVGVHGVLHKHGDVYALQGVGQSLHSKGVGRGAGSYPQDVHVVFQRQFHVFGCGHLGRYQHLGLVLHLLHPHQGGLAMAFKAAGLGAWFPHAGTEVVAAFQRQLACCLHHLFLGLCRTGSGNHKGTLVVTR